MSSPRLTRIAIHPIKSLDPLVVDEATVLAGGALEHDRRFAIRDAAGEFVIGKRTEAVHRLRCRHDILARTVTLRIEGQDAPVGTFHLDRDRADFERWLGEYFELGGPATLVENAASGFPDDTDAPGPTVVSTATLETVTGWFPELSLDDVRLRFRANLEIGGVEPFWEDRLFGEAGQAVRFRIGELLLAGTNPCQRCVVPSRDARSGQAISDFARRFAERRRAALPPWAAASRFDHFYRLAVNTRPAEPGKVRRIRVGDAVAILNEDG